MQPQRLSDRGRPGRRRSGLAKRAVRPAGELLSREGAERPLGLKPHHRVRVLERPRERRQNVVDLRRPGRGGRGCSRPAFGRDARKRLERGRARVAEEEPGGPAPALLGPVQLLEQPVGADGAGELAVALTLDGERRRIQPGDEREELVHLPFGQPACSADDVRQPLQRRALGKGPGPLDDERDQQIDARTTLTDRELHGRRAHAVHGIEEAPLDQAARKRRPRIGEPLRGEGSKLRIGIGEERAPQDLDVARSEAGSEEPDERGSSGVRVDPEDRAASERVGGPGRRRWWRCW